MLQLNSRRGNASENILVLEQYNVLVDHVVGG